MCPEFLTNSILMYIKSYISTTLLTFLKFVYHFAENNLPLIQQTADSLTKIDLVETLIESAIVTKTDFVGSAKVGTNFVALLAVYG